MIYHDTHNDRFYRTFVTLIDMEDPTRPPLIVRMADLLLEERFKEVASTLTCDNLPNL